METLLPIMEPNTLTFQTMASKRLNKQLTVSTTGHLKRQTGLTAGLLYWMALDGTGVSDKPLTPGLYFLILLPSKTRET